MEHPPIWRRGEVPEPVILLRAWWSAAGAGLARAAAVVGVRDGILEVEVADPAWESVLGGHREEIVARLRREPGGGGIRDIVIRRGEREPVLLRSAPAGMGIAAPPREIREAAVKIPDPELARRWVEAVGRLLSRRPPEGRG